MPVELLAIQYESVVACEMQHKANATPDAGGAVVGALDDVVAVR
jgi:hypothetical protein